MSASIKRTLKLQAKNNHYRFLLAIVFFTCLSPQLIAKESPEGAEYLLNLSLVELLEIKISTASRYEEEISKSTSSISVITARQIKHMGARNLNDVLRMIPGMQITVGSSGQTVIAQRGVRSNLSGKTLFLLDGQTISEPFHGNSTVSHLDQVPLENVARIEVVRGPGSAVYGADAFLGIINIITKTPNEINAAELHVSAEYENNNSIGQRYNIMYGKQFGTDKGVALNINFADLNGPDIFIAEDRDGNSGTIDAERNEVDIQLRLELGSFSIRGRFMDHTTGGFYGVANRLPKETKMQYRYDSLEAAYQGSFKDDFTFHVVANTAHLHSDRYIELAPETGVIGNPRYKTSTSGARVQFDYTGIAKHIIITGFEGRSEHLYDVKHYANFNPAPLPSVQDVSQEFNYAESDQRYNSASYIEDLWEFNSNLDVKLSARFDHYNDIGDSFNPQVGFNAKIAEKTNLKFTYGTAFGAPPANVRLTKNNPQTIGNPDLNAEEIETIELSVSRIWNNNLEGVLTLFHNEIDGLIEKNADFVFENFEDITANGIEVEVRFQLDGGGLLDLNYTYVDSELHNGEPFPDYAKQSAYGMLDIPLSKGINFNLNLTWQSDTERDESDSRSDMNSFTVVNASLLILPFSHNSFEFSISGYNLFDKEYSSPSPPPPKTIPGDYRAPGRSVVAAFRLRFDQ